MVQESLGAPSLCSLEQKFSWRLPQEEMHSWFTLFPHQMLSHIHMRLFPNTKNSRMCLRRKMRTPCPSINHTTSPLILRKERKLHSNPSIICHKTNLQLFMNTLMIILRKGSFNIPNLKLVPQFCLSRRRMDPFECVSIIVG